MTIRIAAIIFLLAGISCNNNNNTVNNNVAVDALRPAVVTEKVNFD